MTQTAEPSQRSTIKAYLVGGGIASLASAAYLIRDGGVAGADIRIFEAGSALGGSLDGAGAPDRGYVVRGGRMFTYEAYTCTFDLLSFIPSLTDPGQDGQRRDLRIQRQVHLAFPFAAGATAAGRSTCRPWASATATGWI